MNRIDRYISGLFWIYLIGALLIFVTLLLTIDAMSTMSTYKNVESSLWLKYYLNYLPELVHKLLPVACVIATVMTISILNRANELVALFASGMSLLRITASILFWVTLLSIGGYFMSDRLLPTLMKNKNYIYYAEIKKIPSLYQTVKTNKIWYRSKNAIFNIKTLSLEGNRAQGLTLYFFNEGWDLIQMISAESVEMNGSQWALANGTVTIFSETSSFPMSQAFKQKNIVMNEDSNDLKSTGQTSEMLSQQELMRFIKKNKSAGLDTTTYEVDYHSKFSFAFSALVMCLLGIPFSTSSRRSGGVMFNLGLCLLLVLAYWIFYNAGLNLGKYGSVQPWLGAWLPNLIFGLGALLVIQKK